MSVPTIYRSTDGSAPTLSGTSGDLINLLDKCLRVGYGSQSGAGWTKPYDDAGSPIKTAVFRQGSNGFYVRVNDNAITTGQEARIRGWEVKADNNDAVDGSNTGPFPTDAQASGGLWVRKSNTADGTARPWFLFADSRTFYLGIDQATAGSWFIWHFGDIFSYLSGDAYKCALIARNATGSANTSEMFADLICLISTGSAGHYLARAYTGLGGSTTFGKSGDLTMLNSIPTLAAPNYGFAGGIEYPNGPDGGLYIAPVAVKAEAGALRLRGRMRGLYHQGHVVGSFTDKDTFSGTGDYAGATFVIVKGITGTSGAVGVPVFRTDSWEASS